MDVYGHTKTKYDVPLNHLDYAYVSKCKDVKELEKILKVLRSGTEGTYPDLEKHVEKQLEAIDAQNKLLRKPSRLVTPGELSKEEWSKINDDLENWMNNAKSVERSTKAEDIDLVTEAGDDTVPPVRSGGASIGGAKNKGSGDAESQKSTKKKAMPRDYREWDKLDVDAELEKVDKAPETKPVEKKATPVTIRPTVDPTGLSEPERIFRAEHEKNKGNEAFRAKDFEEALQYYSRSISLHPTAACHNNRAQVYVKLKKWKNAVSDCNIVLKMEPDNVKAVLRRGMAYQGLKEYAKARTDLQTVLAKDPNNKQAQQTLADVEKALADQKVTGRRLEIEEVEGSDSESESATVKSETTNNCDVAETTKICNGTTLTASNGDGKCDGDSVNGVEIDSVGDTSFAAEKEGRRLKDKLSNGKVSSTFDCNGKAVDTAAMSSANTDVSSRNESVAPTTESVTTNGTVTGQTDVSMHRTESEASLSDVMTATSPVLPPLAPHIAEWKDDGNRLFRTGQYGDALEKYNFAIDALSGHTSQAANLSVLLSNRAACRSKIGDCRGCVDDCDKALELSPGSAKALLRRAMAYENMEKYRQAFVDYRRTLQAGGQSDIAQQGSDRCAAMLQQLDGPRWRDKLPETSLPASVSTRPAQPSSSQTPVTGAVHSSTRPVSSAASSKTAAAVNEEKFEKFKTEGNSFFNKGEYVKAIGCFTHCIDLSPDKVVPYTNRAICNLKLNKPVDVVSDCDVALKLEQHNVKALFRRAQAYRMLDRLDECHNDLDTLLKVEPNNVAARKELQAVLLCKQKRRQEAAATTPSSQRHRLQIEEVESESEEEDVTPRQSSVVGEKKLIVETGATLSDKSDSCVGTTGDTTTSSVKTRDTSSANTAPPTVTSTTPSAGTTSTPRLIKATPYEFMHSWTSLKFVTEIEPYVGLLEQIEPQELPKVISNKLEGDILTKLVRCVGQVVDKGDVRLGYDYLHHLTKVPRFDMVAMFMSEDEKQETSRVFERISKNAAPGTINSKQLIQTRSRYGV